jgi:hypothetical protein
LDRKTQSVFGTSVAINFCAQHVPAMKDVVRTEMKGRRMASTKESRREQVTVALDGELRAAIERAAAADHRTLSGQIRYLLATMIEQQTGRRVAA